MLETDMRYVNAKVTVLTLLSEGISRVIPPLESPIGLTEPKVLHFSASAGSLGVIVRGASC